MNDKSELQKLDNKLDSLVAGVALLVTEIKVDQERAANLKENTVSTPQLSDWSNKFSDKMVTKITDALKPLNDDISDNETTIKEVSSKIDDKETGLTAMRGRIARNWLFLRIHGAVTLIIIEEMIRGYF